MAARDDATWIFLHDGMPDHPKIEALSDKAFRRLIELWCYCRRHRTDGRLTEAAWRKRTTPAVRKELIDAGLVDVQTEGNGVEMHDYLDWQSSADEMAAFSASKRAAGALGNHKRWHVDQRKYDPACEHCNPEGRSHVRSQPPSQPPSHEQSRIDRLEEKRREEVPSGPVESASNGDQHAREDDLPAGHSDAQIDLMSRQGPRPRGGSRGVTDTWNAVTNTQAARRIVDAYAATCTLPPAGRLYAEWAAAVQRLLAAGVPAKAIERGLAECGAKGYPPAALQKFVYGEANRRTPTAKPNRTDSIVAGLQALKTPTDDAEVVPLRLAIGGS